MKKNISIRPNKSLNGYQIIFFLIITGFLIFFIGIRFILVGAWPIIVFGIVEFGILVLCSYFFFKSTKKEENISLNDSTLTIQKKQEGKDDVVIKHNLAWVKVKNEKDSLSVNYSGKKTFFAGFLNIERRLKLKKIIDRYKLRF